METAANLILSDTELAFVQDKEFILAKQRIISVVFDMFSIHAKNLQQVIETEKIGLPPEMLYTIPKIYKGENYQNFPYVMLDYPAVFGKESVLALRHMFWWGNFFSVTLHVSGEFKERFTPGLFTNIIGSKEELYVCINDNQWQHHFQIENYISIKSINENELKAILERQTFLKIALQYSISDWQSMILHLEEGSLKLLKLIVG